MRDDFEDQTTDAVKEADASTKHEKRRYVFLPMLKSFGAAACTVALATAVAACIAAPSVELPGQSHENNPTAHAEKVKKAGSFVVPDPEAPAMPDSDPAGAATPSDDSGGNEDGDKDEPTDVVPNASNADSSGSANPDVPNSQAAPDGGAGSGGGEAEASQSAGHQHSWTAETKTVDHPAETKDISHEAVYDTKKWTQCSCGADITGNVSGHMKAHALAGESATYHTEESRVCVKEAWTEYGVVVRGAWSEDVPTGCEVCSCGARR